MHYEVRPAVLADLPQVATLQSHGFGHQSAGQAAELASELESPDRWLWVTVGHAGAGDRARVVAFARLRIVDSADGPPTGYYLAGMVVDPDHRGRGLGSGLIRARIDFGLSAGARELYYFANARNATSIALHAKFGFREVQRPFQFPGVVFEGGIGVLFRLDDLREAREASTRAS
jgi:ribosomal protein S18 acetylase RimI-like enzyme